MKYYKITVLVFMLVILVTACSPASAPVKFSMAQSTSTGCATPEPGEVGSCKVNATMEPTAASTEIPIVVPTLVPTTAATTIPTKPSTPTKAPAGIARVDSQGAVSVEIKPEDLNPTGDFLLFDVSLDTHSIDLSMDLAPKSTLTTDNGKTVQATKWDAPRGGHHVSGKLVFPANLNGNKLLDGANSLTITIKNVDTPVRTFTWKLPG